MPYADLLTTIQNRDQSAGEYELFDALRDQWLQQHCFDVRADYAKPGLMVQDERGRRATHGDNEYFQTDPHWNDLVPSHEYFDGDTGRGLGASYQSGWTATVALLPQFRGRLRFG